ncbi:MAG TPA: ABC transporter substrate-binding protein [Candidatus Binatia bacterium]|nr:ABC transporter substrate-binding protein [Candidatus Binatia bacterium]
MARFGGHPARSIGVLLVALLASACAPAHADPPDFLVVGVEALPTSFDPRSALDAVSEQVSALVHRGLTAPAPDGAIAPDLAIAWEPDGPLGWRFHLGSARFHDGSPVTAADVVATYRSLALPAFQGAHAETLDAVASVEAEDERTVRFTLRAPFAPFLATTALGIVPAGCAETTPCPIGSGPFRWAGRDVDAVALAAAPTADPPPRLPGIVFRASPDGTARALGLARGTIHLVQNAVEPELVPWLASRGLEVVKAPGTTFQYLGFNLRVPALADPRVRRAIAHAIDADAIVAHLLDGLARPASELFPPGHWAHAGVARPAYDPARARALLAEAGALPLRLEVKTSTVELRRRIAEAIAGFLSDVGIAVDLRPLEWGAMFGDVRRGRFELVSLAWVGVQDPDLYFGWLRSDMAPPRGNNRGGYANALVDELAADGRRNADADARGRVYRSLADEVARDLPYVPLWWTDNVVVKTPRLAGFAPVATGDLRGLARAWWREPPAPARPS